jgi:hypothetical protein
MTGPELLELLHRGKRRSHVIGTPENGIVVGLDNEGRLFTVLNGQVLNRVVPSAIINHSNKSAYQNPGGDALWPAPEGTCFGYEYGTGKWRVPPAITGAVWEVEHSVDKTVIRAEIDLVNNLQIGIPCEFERHIEHECRGNAIVQQVSEKIRYIGVKELKMDEFRLAPWSLCQFDAAPESKVMMPPPSDEDIWDMYDSSLSRRDLSGGKYTVQVKTDFRFQLGLSEKVEWIEYVSGDEYSVKRSAGPLPSGQNYIDIADAPPEQLPSDKGVKFSVYCDPSGFMEIEACGGCPDTLVPGTELSVSIVTAYMQHSGSANK